MFLRNVGVSPKYITMYSEGRTLHKICSFRLFPNRTTAAFTLQLVLEAISFDIYIYFNLVKPTGYYMCHMLQRTKTLNSAHRVYLCVLYGSHNKQRLFSETGTS
jgi:hypothetical protein